MNLLRGRGAGQVVRRRTRRSEGFAVRRWLQFTGENEKVMNAQAGRGLRVPMNRNV
ncbi:hypothetical protein [Mycolicibacterium baixiangningiae]|uniref:hypothetical protein n=1 Tax=Mycolicibacterium baixiangningiae TaxID=2761578 RepID=UPI0018D0E5A6|nr:hypothetical protein [Mycolicibacterium baixiangningiae]